ncbi:MAG: DUF4351 domain-containing protein, partial [Gammaproteobacteria bacterium]|nr:DUF4351 domain-containing protein [Gammaproteobacteria bacterium]
DYLVCALGDMPAADWLDSSNLVARLNLPNMRAPANSRVDVYASAVRGLLDLERNLSRREKYIEFIDIYAGLNDNERRIYRERHPKESNIMTGMFQRAREEGMQLGRVAGERTLLERQLRRKFGALPSVVDARLSNASVADLEAWGENVLDADTINEVFNPH